MPTRFTPILLRSDNFTPTVRTPWGGKKIINKYKALAPLSEDKKKYEAVGESWELSVEPDFPSVTRDEIALAEILASEPEKMLGIEAEQGRTTTALLVKLLDAGENLSLQIHPSSDYKGLGEGETGKAECWYVIDHDEGAGIYFGLRPGVDESLMRSRIEAQGEVSKLLYFVPVSRGDLFVIEPGTPHAIGKGVTLLEPQFVLPGHRGVTYRYWDWNRRYDEMGRVQAVGGKPRQLHIERALAVTDWSRTGEFLLDACYFDSGRAEIDVGAALAQLCGPEGEAPVKSSCLRAARLTGSGSLPLPSWNALGALTVIEGAICLGEKEDEIRVVAGQTVAIPACLSDIPIHLQRCHAVLCAVHASRQGR
ncbi:MAG: class I mannose-6-phosphate isomerase [Deltaproteobacteria bacterium]|nr:class I mannose-6-phosphate isomerase [Deltaproteobacteria bacterium]